MAAQQMPEELGIGRLNAGNMDFADGGIIGYAGGGEVERYNGLTGSVTGGLYDTAKSRLADAQKKLYTYGLVQRQRDPEGFKAAQQALQAAQADFNRSSQAYTADVEAAGMNRPAFGAPVASPQMPAVAQATAPAAPLAIPPTDAAAAMAAKASASPYVSTGPKSAEEAALLSRYPTSGPKAAPKADTVRKIPVAGPSAAAAAAQTPAESADKEPQGLDALIRNFTRESDLATGAARNARVGLAAAVEQVPKDRAARNKKELEAEGDVYKDREARLAAREKSAEGMDDKYLGLALLQAGAAMMSTPGGIGAALGKGVQVGSERYIAGMDKINAAKEKFAEARERLEDLRLNRSDMTKKQIRDDQREIDNAQIQAKQLLSDGLNNDLKVSNENQKAFFSAAASALETDKRIKSSENIAGMQERAQNARSAAQIKASLNKPDQILWDQSMAKSNNDAFKALEVFKAAKGDKFDVRPLYAEHIKDMAKAGMPPESFATYAARFGAILPR
jgi:hypothetical protein